MLAAATAALLLCGWIAATAEAPAARTTRTARAARTSTSFAAAGCRSYGSLEQSMNGRVSGCVRIGAVRPGPHTIVLLQMPNLPTNVPAGVLRKLKGAPKVRPPREPAVRLTVSPSSGPPGTTVTITGHSRSSLPRGQLSPDFCWDGCPAGLQYGGLPIRRSSPHTFRERIVVPAAPWVQGGPVHVARLESGDYAIGVQCLLSGKGCSSLPAEGSASFHLVVGASLSWCRAQAGCARLKVAPAEGIPGDVVKVTGVAPLVSISGADRPFVFELEVLRGRPGGPEVHFRTRLGNINATFGHGVLDVKAPPSFASLGDIAPLAEVSDRLPPIDADPAHPSTVAWCGDGTIGVSSAGATSMIPTAAAADELTKLGFQVFAGQPLSCQGVAPIDSASGSPAGVVAAFQTGPGNGGPPFFYDVPVVTYDGGQSWQPLPVPPGSSLAGFGGLRYQNGALEAVFAARGSGGTVDYPTFDAGRPLAEVNGPAPTTWQAEPLGCQTGGPCATIGPFFPGNCAMIEDDQPLLHSTDGGVRWSEAAAPDYVQACAESELVMTSVKDALLVNTMSPYPLVRSTDGGASWSDVGLPPAPGEQRGRSLGPGPDGITFLPDGGLLLTGGQGYHGHWELLAPRGRAWCAVSSPALAVQRRYQVSPVTVIGNTLWWLTGSPAGDAPAVINSAPLSSLSC